MMCWFFGFYERSCCFIIHGNFLLLNPSFTKPFGTHTFFTKEGGRGPSYLKNRCPHEHEILQGIRDTFESLRNVEVVTQCLLGYHSNSSKERCFGGKIARFQLKIPIIQIATKFTIFKIEFPANSPIIAYFKNIIFV